MGIKLNFITPGSSKNTTYKGGNIPPWYGDYSLDSRYYDNSQTHYYYNQVGNTIYVQYGNPRSGWATNTFYGYNLETSNIKELENGKISVDVKMTFLFYISRSVPPKRDGIRVAHKIYLGDNLVAENNGWSGHEITKTDKKEFTTTIILEPEEKSNKTAFLIKNVYPNKEYPNTSIYIGMQIENTNKKIVNYIPMAIRKNKEFKSLNKNKGFIKIRKNNSYIDKSTENLGDKGKENKGKNRIRKNKKWLQQGEF